ncbi:MAG: DUF4921 family protein [Actinomycetaceae bacterium]|nr:DUF4921 family protein [Actinomycetaceae bacterium]MDY6082291.1 DUF4921 family protein [Actinomycetaceae bacterium]
MSHTEFIRRMPDGTMKQINPFSGTEVWTVPGRANRPIGMPPKNPQPLKTNRGDDCAFCWNRVLETPPEKARIVRDNDKSKGEVHIVRNAPVDDLADPWEFRRIPNLFEIVSYTYWQKNYGYDMSPSMRARMEGYIADPAGKAHLLSVLGAKARAGQRTDWDGMEERDQLREAEAFFGGGHDVVVSRRHFVDGATDDSQLASAGTLTPMEHFWYMQLTIDAMRDLYAQNRYARYVQVFQNWLKPSGASFDHLHKQLVAIDERSVNADLEIPKVRQNPNIYNEDEVDYAGYHNLVIAENTNAVAIAGFGHRYPTIEIWSRSEALQPWEHSLAEQRDMSNMVHAIHAASGPHMPSNEEWYCAPIDTDVRMPWHVAIKWRVSNVAGFEGGTKIYVNTLDPYHVRDRVVPELLQLRADGKIAQDISIATECTCRVNSLKYNRALQ